MKILIAGAGLSGCSLGRLLADRGHQVNIIEKKPILGGLCITRLDKYGNKYEPYGARTFHSKNPRVIEFMQRFDKFNGYTHRKGMIIHNKLFPFPITLASLDGFENKAQILAELNSRPEKINSENFETACLSIFGPTLYSYFIKNYTEKMWGIDPKQLKADWAPKRLELRTGNNDELFTEQWQGLPVHGYSYLLSRMAGEITIQYNTTSYNPSDYDVVITTAPIDEIFSYKYGKLPYRSLKFRYKYNEIWENDLYGTINLPQHPFYIRKCNFKILHRQEYPYTRIQYQAPIPSINSNMPMYPINTVQNDAIFDQYLYEISRSPNTIPAGRLALYKYLDMDKAVEIAFDMVDIVENYLDLDFNERYNAIKAIRDSY